MHYKIIFVKNILLGGRSSVFQDLTCLSSTFRVSVKIAKERKNKILTYGKREVPSEVTLVKQSPSRNGQHLVIEIFDKVYSAFFPVLGKFQAYNLLCAICIVISSGVEYRGIRVEKLFSPPGRIEKVGPFAFVDYAHTPSALKQVLLSLKWHFKKKIILVFGCGGDRDQAKRSDMGKISRIYADKVVITDDNPRNEDPAKIRHDILLHCSDALEIVGRREAIEKGLDIAYNHGMLLLVAGKGHEKFQIVGDQALRFDDVEIIQNNKLDLNGCLH